MLVWIALILAIAGLAAIGIFVRGMIISEQVANED